jgi:hypothetical protein
MENLDGVGQLERVLEYLLSDHVDAATGEEGDRLVEEPAERPSRSVRHRGGW